MNLLKQAISKLVKIPSWRAIFYLAIPLLSGIPYSYAALPSSVPAGLVLYDINGAACSITLQQNSKIIVAARLRSPGSNQLDTILARFDSNGLLDTTFGFNGRVRIGPSSVGANIDVTGINGYEGLCSGAIQADGKIVLGGTIYRASESPHIGVLRLSQNGQLDNSFGSNGLYELTDFSENYGNQIAIDSQQRIVVAGSVKAPFGSNYGSRGLAIRLIGNGQLDSNFNDNTRFFLWNVTARGEVDASSSAPYFIAVATQPDNSILLGGCSGSCSSFNSDAVVLRLTPGGKIDTSFADSGVRYLPLEASGNKAINLISIDSIGRIIATGSSYTYAGSSTLIYRLSADGNLDPSFVNGYIPYLGYRPPAGQSISPSDIWLVGSTSVSYYDDYVALAKLKEDGTGNPFNTADINYPSTPSQRTWRIILDNSFCGEPPGGAVFQGNKILVTGTYDCGNLQAYQGIYLLRFNPDGSIDETFGTGLPQPPEEKVAVVLIHGIDGSAGSFSGDGKLYRDGLNGEEVCSSEEYRFDPTCQPKFGRLLAKNTGLIVAKPFDYSDKTGLLAADWTIEQLAGELHKHIECVLAALSDCIHLPPGIDHIDRVDIVAHSMGGLITRAYMAGMAQNCIRNGDNYCQSSTSVTYPEVNGKGIIRKFVTVGTPHYGSPYLNRLREFVIDSTSNQAHQIEVGSELVLHLHDKLADKGMHDSDFLAIAGLRIPNKREKDEDGIVSASSAVLPTELLAEDRILYVPYRHTSSVAIPPLDALDYPQLPTHC